MLRRCFLFAASVVLGALPSFARAADDPAAALLAKHAAYVGWRGGDGGLTSLRETGEIRRDGKVVGELRRLQLGQVYRASISRASKEFDDGFTGRVFWESNVNGFTTKVNGELVKFLAAEVQLHNEELTSLPGSVRGTETIDGVATTTVRVMTLTGLPVDLSIDPQTGAFARIVIDPDGRYETRLNALIYTDVGKGKRVLSSWRYGNDAGVFSYTRIEANTDISADELHPPKTTASWTFGSPTQTVPIRVTDTRIFVDATVNGHLGHFVLDTGAAGIVFTDSFARLIGAKRHDQTRIVGIGGGVNANVYSLDTFTLGQSTLRDVVFVTGLDERYKNDESFDGLIGFDLLAGAIVELDLDAQTMRILDPKLVAPDRTQGITLNVDLAAGVPRVPMTAGGRVPVIATLDSGDSFYALFSSQLVSRGHAKFFSPPDTLAARLQMRGVNGEETDTCGQLDSLELGPITYRPVPACMSDSMAYNDVLLGFDFFKNFNYVFDYPDGVMLLTKRKGR